MHLKIQCRLIFFTIYNCCRYRVSQGKVTNRILGLMFCCIVLSQRLPRLPPNLALPYIIYLLQILVSQHKPQHSVGFFFLGHPVDDQFDVEDCNSMDCQCIVISCIVCIEGEAQAVSSPELTFLGLCTTTGGLLGDLVPLKKSDSTPCYNEALSTLYLLNISLQQTRITDPNPAHISTKDSWTPIPFISFHQL